MIRIMITPHQVRLFLTSIVGVLVLLHLAGQVVLLEGDDTGSYWLIQLFNVDNERSFPTLFSFSILQYAAFLLGLITFIKRRLSEPYVFYWGLLCAVFVFLSFDEMLALHERLITPSMSWVLPYLVVCSVFLLNFLRFLKHLPTETRNRFIAAGLLYVGGAMGLEIPGGQYYHNYGADAPYVILVTLEETFEMMGIVLFIYALTDYLSHYLPQVSFEPYAPAIVQRKKST